MTNDDLLKVSFGAVLAAISSAVTWLIAKVLGNRESIVVAKGKLESLEEKVDALEASSLTLEDVRSVIEAALDRRDAALEVRRKEQYRILTMEIRQAVSDAVRACQKFHNDGSMNGEAT